jgi:hypothetical protein
MQTKILFYEVKKIVVTARFGFRRTRPKNINTNDAYSNLNSHHLFDKEGK